MAKAINPPSHLAKGPVSQSHNRLLLDDQAEMNMNPPPPPKPMEESDESDGDDEDDDEEGLEERTEICRLAQPLFPGKDIKVRMNYNYNLCQAVIEVKVTNDTLMTGEEKSDEALAYRDLWEMVREVRRRRGFGDR